MFDGLLPPGHVSDVVLHRPVALPFGDLRIAAGEQLGPSASLLSSAMVQHPWMVIGTARRDVLGCVDRDSVARRRSPEFASRTGQREFRAMIAYGPTS